MTRDPLLPCRAGFYNIADSRPGVELVPTWIANLNAILPKRRGVTHILPLYVPLPLILHRDLGGAPVALQPGEDRGGPLSWRGRPVTWRRWRPPRPSALADGRV